MPKEEGTLDIEIARPVTVIIEKRRIAHPWQEWAWRPAAVLVGETGAPAGAELERSGDTIRYAGGVHALTLHRSECAAYTLNLELKRVLYVVLRPQEEGPPRVHLVTASPYEAEAHTISGEEIVEEVRLDPELAAWIAAFVERQPPEKPFVKRQREYHDPEEARFGKE